MLATVSTFLPFGERFLSLTHVSHGFTSGLSPACFRGHLLVDKRLISALPSLSDSTFTFISSATSLTVQYGSASSKAKHRSPLFDAQSPRHLLHFRSFTSLHLEFKPHSFGKAMKNMFEKADPLSSLSHLLSTAPQPILPHLSALTLKLVPSPYIRWPLPLHLLPSLTSLTLDAVKFDDVDQLYELLSLPALQRLDLSRLLFHRACPPERVKVKEEQCLKKLHTLAKKRGVELKGFHYVRVMRIHTYRPF